MARTHSYPGAIYGAYLTLSSWVLFYLASQTDAFSGGTAINLVSLQYGNADQFCQTDYGLTPDSPDFNQCVTEQQWSRQSMLRALMYAQVWMALVYMLSSRAKRGKEL